eukprot:gnl/MRDRNA2_/MRDRNA2_124646_c0_seq1.p1 gnl/MRDRNA2_/MRDRNA2_124646_c0~~gnl/MRDRNA2_/MRDRNA2_124646_c0_seq1.p1  ORF type:complete len:604 (+),score=138.66 gnl/MRDRNA2_/MRDRNA2_124646_c0_seq1:52-1863(+)
MAPAAVSFAIRHQELLALHEEELRIALESQRSQLEEVHHKALVTRDEELQRLQIDNAELRTRLARLGAAASLAARVDDTATSLQSVDFVLPSSLKHVRGDARDADVNVGENSSTELDAKTVSDMVLTAVSEGGHASIDPSTSSNAERALYAQPTSAIGTLLAELLKPAVDSKMQSSPAPVLAKGCPPEGLDWLFARAHGALAADPKALFPLVVAATDGAPVGASVDLCNSWRAGVAGLLRTSLELLRSGRAMVEDIAFAAFYAICLPDVQGPLGNPAWLNDDGEGLGDEMLDALPPNTLALDLCDVNTAVARFLTRSNLKAMLGVCISIDAETDTNLPETESVESKCDEAQFHNRSRPQPYCVTSALVTAHVLRKLPSDIQLAACQSVAAMPPTKSTCAVTSSVGSSGATAKDAVSNSRSIGPRRSTSAASLHSLKSVSKEKRQDSSKVENQMIEDPAEEEASAKRLSAWLTTAVLKELAPEVVDWCISKLMKVVSVLEIWLVTDGEQKVALFEAKLREDNLWQQHGGLLLEFCVAVLPACDRLPMPVAKAVKELTLQLRVEAEVVRFEKQKEQQQLNDKQKQPIAVGPTPQVSSKIRRNSRK